MNQMALEVDNLSKYFGGLPVISNVNMRIPQGDARGIIGPNGAGKTTLLNLLSGLIRPGKGRISYFGKTITKASVESRSRIGLGRSFQINSLFETLTLRENLTVAAMGSQPRKLGILPRANNVVVQRVEKVAADFGLSTAMESRIGLLPYGTQRMSELAMGCVAQPRILLLDEPSSGLGLAERRELADRLTSITSAGITLVMIEHDMDLVRAVCNSLSVLDRGELIADGGVAEVMEDDHVNRVYLGEE